MKKLHMSSAVGCGKPSAKCDAAMKRVKMWLVLVLTSVWMKSLRKSSRSGCIGGCGMLLEIGRGSGGAGGCPDVGWL